MELKYDIKIYARNNDGLAPPELKKIWPSGLSPVVEIFKPGQSKPIVLAELGQIVQYLIANYDPQNKLKPETESDQVLVDYYLHFAEGTLQPNIVSLAYNKIAVGTAPEESRESFESAINFVNDNVYLKRLLNNLSFLEGQLERNGGGYFVGKKLTGADVILEFPAHENLLDPRWLKGLGYDIPVAEKFPRLFEWIKLITERPLFKKSAEKQAQVLATA